VRRGLGGARGSVPRTETLRCHRQCSTQVHGSTACSSPMMRRTCATC
jgi:hypothetical protein